jgi:hypothetical protein
MKERQQTHRTPAILRLEGNYGPDGMAFMSAAILWGLAGSVVGITGLICLFASADHGRLLATGYALIFIGIILELPSIVRAVQGIHAGRSFRGDRPFVRS